MARTNLELAAVKGPHSMITQQCFFPDGCVAIMLMHPLRGTDNTVYLLDEEQHVTHMFEIPYCGYHQTEAYGSYITDMIALDEEHFAVSTNHVGIVIYNRTDAHETRRFNCEPIISKLSCTDSRIITQAALTLTVYHSETGERIKQFRINANRYNKILIPTWYDPDSVAVYYEEYNQPSGRRTVIIETYDIHSGQRRAILPLNEERLESLQHLSVLSCHDGLQIAVGYTGVVHPAEGFVNLYDISAATPRLTHRFEPLGGEDVMMIYNTLKAHEISLFHPTDLSSGYLLK